MSLLIPHHCLNHVLPWNTSKSLYFHAVFSQLATFESTNAGKYLIFYSKFNEQEGRKYKKNGLSDVFSSGIWLLNMCFLSKHQRKWSISVFTSCVFDPLSARIHFLMLWLKFQLHFQVIKQETWLVGCIRMISSCLGKEVWLDVNIFLWLMKINLKLRMGKRAKS